MVAGLRYDCQLLHSCREGHASWHCVAAVHSVSRRYGAIDCLPYSSPCEPFVCVVGCHRKAPVWSRLHILIEGERQVQERRV